MAPRGGRRAWTPAAAYFLLLVFTMWLLAGSFSPAPAVRPALAGMPDVASPPPSWLEVRLGQPFWRLVLQSGLPPLRSEPPPEAAEGEVGWLPTLSAAVPVSLLRFGLPGLSLVNLPPPGTLASTADGGGIAAAGPPAPVPGPAPQTPKAPVDAELTQCGSAPPTVLIYHTHSQESFLSLLRPGTPTDEAFSADRAQSIVHVGDELNQRLCDVFGLSVVHLRTRFDADGRLGAYVHSLAGVQAALKHWPTLHVLLDVHRDDAPRDVTTASVGGQPTARVLIVVGNDQTLPNPAWRQNAAWAVQVSRALNATHPGLARAYEGKPYYSDGGRFNQQLSPAALLFEVGGQDNTMPEELRAADMLAEVLAGLVKAGEYPH